VETAESLSTAIKCSDAGGWGLEPLLDDDEEDRMSDGDSVSVVGNGGSVGPSLHSSGVDGGSSGVSEVGLVEGGERAVQTDKD
jgi:hypothetical protein